MPWKQCLKNIWIIKPTNSNQGKGIEVFKELTKIKSFLRGKPHDEEWIFSKISGVSIAFVGVESLTSGYG